MKRYKLINENMETYNNTKWRVGEWKEVPGTGELCSSGWLHVYTHPLLAVILNPAHANFKTPLLFECECEGRCKEDNGLKEGWQRVMLIKEIMLPKITIEQRVKFGILCALEVYKEKNFTKWAKDWLSRKNRSKETAKEARAGAENILWIMAERGWRTREGEEKKMLKIAFIRAAAWVGAQAVRAASGVTCFEDLRVIEEVGEEEEYSEAAAGAGIEAAMIKKINLITIAKKAVFRKENS